MARSSEITGNADSPKFCVIGAGPAGLTAAKNLLQRRIPVEVLEREDDVGGNWYYGRPSSSVCASTHMISSKRLTQYTDFPMPEEFPHYPHHSQVLDYLRSYARQFDLYEVIRLRTEVQRAEPSDAGWNVWTSDQQTPRRYRGLIIANGHHWDPHWPQFPGKFSGKTLHTREYDTPDEFHGQRVLVIGAGNSGCDVAVEAARHARSAAISMRRGYHFLPKFFLGRPTDQCGHLLQKLRLPLRLRRLLARGMVELTLGQPPDAAPQHRLPSPDHRLFETHPIINSQLVYHLGHGDLRVKPNVSRFDGQAVVFEDGSREEFDVVVFATGFNVTFPFIDLRHLNGKKGLPRLYLNAFHPQRDDLFVIGMIQPNSGSFGLADLQCQLTAEFIAACDEGSAAADWFRRQKAEGNPDLSRGIRYVDSPRHSIEVEYYSYWKRLQRLIRKMRRLRGGHARSNAAKV